MYIEVVKNLKNIIELDGLKAGDKIPSERELSERLHVGRSSVREALRALELLGLIETRVGEGTFLRDARANQLVQLLGTFILQDDKSKKDVKETKHLIEMDCLKLVSARNDKEQLLQLKRWTQDNQFGDGDFFLKVIESADNHLYYRIWVVLNDFERTLNVEKTPVKSSYYLALVDALMGSDETKIQKAYEQLRNLSTDS